MDFGDGNTETSATVTHSYDSSDNYTVTLEVTDSEDRRDTDSLDIEVNSSTTVEIVNDFESQDGQAVNPNWGSEVIADDRNTQIDGYITTTL
jgi:PKD repeat protein